MNDRIETDDIDLDGTKGNGAQPSQTGEVTQRSSSDAFIALKDYRKHDSRELDFPPTSTTIL